MAKRRLSDILYEADERFIKSPTKSCAFATYAWLKSELIANGFDVSAAHEWYHDWEIWEIGD